MNSAEQETPGNMMGSGTGLVRRLCRLHIIVGLGLIGFLFLVFHQVRDIDSFAGSSTDRFGTSRQAKIQAVQDNGGGVPGGLAGGLNPPLNAAAPPPVIDMNNNKAAGLLGGDELVYYRKDIPLIWIGGVPRSGTTLMRAMLDAHGEIRCGEETRVIPRILGMHTGMEKSAVEMSRLQEAKINSDVLNSALGAYILSIISQHGEPAPHLCNKDPFTLRSMTRLINIFPNSKFILMIRDGRATAHSIISRHVTIKGFDIKTYRGALKDWNRAITAMYNECTKSGPERCLPVHYEQLVLHPESQMRRILTFLDIPWDESVMHHELSIGKKDGISLSKKELSTDQVDKPVNTGALINWVEHIPQDVRDEIDHIAPMLKTLGYDSHAYPPNYGTPDKQVQQNSDGLKNKAAAQPPPIDNKAAAGGHNRQPVVL